jgi:methyl-accepting chemotaxis protein
MSIRMVSLVFSCTAALLVVGTAGYAIMSEYQRLLASRAVGNSVTAISLLNKATVEISFERSLSQVGLALPDRFPDRFRDLLVEQRRKSDELFARLEEILRERDLLNEEAFASQLARERSRLAELRRAIDPDLALSKANRSAQGASRIEALKATVVAFKDLGDLIRPDAVGLPNEVASHDLLMQRAWIIREYGGRERTYFAIATALGAPVPTANLPEMHESNGRVLQAWSLTESLLKRETIAPEVKTAVEAVRQQYFDVYGDLRERMYAAAGSASYPVDFENYFAQSSQALETAVVVVTRAGEANIRLAEELYDKAERNLIVIGLVSLLMLAATGWTVRYFLTHVSSRLVGITRTMREVADGHLDVDLARFQSRDEVGDMASALAIFVDNAKARRRLEAQARADRDMELLRQDKLERLVGTFRTEIANVETVLKTEMVALSGAAEHLLEVGDQTAQHSVRAGEASNDANAYVQSVGTIAQRLFVSIGDLASQAQATRAMVETATHDAEQSSTRVQELVRSAERIGEVVGLIRSIAEQTNLLALNATIEAARAGDAGRGFAVVAGEVKSLAEQTARATDEIADQVTAIQSSTRLSVDAIMTITSTMHRIATATEALATGVTEQRSATTSIDQSIGHAVTGARTTAQALVALKDAVQATNGEAARVRQTAQQVEDVTERLSTAVEGFLKGVAKDISDRRVETRYPANDPIMVFDARRRQRAHLVDICNHGFKVRFEGTPMVAAGDRVRVEWKGTPALDVEVMWVTQTEAGMRTAQAIDHIVDRYAA